MRNEATLIGYCSCNYNKLIHSYNKVAITRNKDAIMRNEVIYKIVAITVNEVTVTK